MNTTELKVGQLWYVDDASVNGFACPLGSEEGDIIEITKKDPATSDGWRGYNHAQDQDDIIIYDYDLNVGLKYIGTKETHGHLIESFTAASGDVSPAWHTSVPQGVESVSQAPTDSFKDILWHIISRAERYNGHSQFTVSDMDLDTLMRLTRMLDDYVEEFCELRLSWGGDHMGYYTADIYEIASVREGSGDKILMSVEKVTGI